LGELCALLTDRRLRGRLDLLPGRSRGDRLLPEPAEKNDVIDYEFYKKLDDEEKYLAKTKKEIEKIKSRIKKESYNAEKKESNRTTDSRNS
jgi:hypothetical protein